MCRLMDCVRRSSTDCLCSRGMVFRATLLSSAGRSLAFWVWGGAVGRCRYAASHLRCHSYFFSLFNPPPTTHSHTRTCSSRAGSPRIRSPRPKPPERDRRVATSRGSTITIRTSEFLRTSPDGVPVPSLVRVIFRRTRCDFSTNIRHVRIIPYPFLHFFHSQEGEEADGRRRGKGKMERARRWVGMSLFLFALRR